MPELPDVENYRRYLARHALSKKIRHVVVSTPRIVDGLFGDELGRRLKGRMLQRARRHGKHLLAALDDGCWLAFHSGMTGRLAHFEDGDLYHARLHPQRSARDLDRRTLGRLHRQSRRVLETAVQKVPARKA